MITVYDYKRWFQTFKQESFLSPTSEMIILMQVHSDSCLLNSNDKVLNHLNKEHEFFQLEVY